MKKKSIVIFSLLVIAGILVVGCGGQTAAPVEEQTAEKVWSHPQF
jgi:hypothetical protein